MLDPVVRSDLKGLLVISLEQAVAAPFCSSRLADAGARVIKIERAEGDFARRYDGDVRGQSAYFVWLNRGKESVTLDIKDAADLAFLRTLIGHADIFIQNLAPGATARAGLHGQELLLRHPQLIVCDISGYGDTGPYAAMKAYDLLVQAESGLASVTGTPEGGPARVGVSVADIGTGMYAYMAILEALYARQFTGVGRALAVSLFDTLAEWMNVPYLQYRYAGRTPQRVGLNHPTIAPYGAYACGDGSVLFAVQNEREWHAFCTEVLGNEALEHDVRFARAIARVANRPALKVAIEVTFKLFSVEDIAKRLSEAGIAFGRVNDVEGLARHPQLRTAVTATEGGDVELIASPARSTGYPTSYGDVPRLGEHTEAVRREFGSPGERKIDFSS